MLVKTILLSLALVSAASFVTASSNIADIDMVLNNGTVVIQEHKSLEPKTNAEAIALGLPLLRPRSLPWTKPSTSSS